jgi:hypothetical protein
MDEFPYVAHFRSAFTRTGSNSCKMFTSACTKILLRWKSYWIGPLLVLVALLSVAVLQFRTLRSKKSGAACLANSAAASSAVARHVTPGTSTPSDQGEAEHTASAAGKSDIRYSDAVHTATANAGSFSEEFQIALQLKSAHNLAAAGQRRLIFPRA